MFFIYHERLIILSFFISFIFIPSYHRIRTAFFSLLFSILGSIHFILPLFYIVSSINLFSLVIILPFLIKIPTFPSYYRSPEVHCEANTSIPLFLAGLLLKLSIFGIIRFILCTFYSSSRFLSIILIYLILIGIIIINSPYFHAPISERGGKPKPSHPNGSITAFPIIETIANDITEHIATNIIPITDRQSYTNRKLLLDSCRPSIDSALPASRIGSNAQCKLIKVIPVGSKNEPTNYRIMELSSSSIDFFKPLSSNHISFQDHLYIPSINPIVIPIRLYRNGIFFNKAIRIQRLLLLFPPDYSHYHHIILIIKPPHPLILYYYLSSIYSLLFIYSLFYIYR